MELREIKGFPNYMLNADTGEIISKLTRNTTLKVRQIHNRPSMGVQMIQDGKRRWIYYNRLMYAIRHGIGYDDIPEGMFIVKDDEGELKVITKSQQVEFANNYVKAARRRERLKRIDDRIHELEIMRRAYSKGGNHIEAAQYIESRKTLLICHHQKRYHVSRQHAEDIYALALERMIDRINDPDSQVLELTISMMGLMNKVRQRLSKERPLGLRNETPSNSLTGKER